MAKAQKETKELPQERMVSVKQLYAQKQLRDALHNLIDSYSRVDYDDAVGSTLPDLWTEVAQNVAGKHGVSMEQRKAAKEVGFKLAYNNLDEPGASLIIDIVLATAQIPQSARSKFFEKIIDQSIKCDSFKLYIADFRDDNVIPAINWLQLAYKNEKNQFAEFVKRFWTAHGTELTKLQGFSR